MITRSVFISWSFNVRRRFGAQISQTTGFNNHFKSLLKALLLKLFIVGFLSLPTIFAKHVGCLKKCIVKKNKIYIFTTCLAKQCCRTFRRCNKIFAHFKSFMQSSSYCETAFLRIDSFNHFFVRLNSSGSSATSPNKIGCNCANSLKIKINI